MVAYVAVAKLNWALPASSVYKFNLVCALTASTFSVKYFIPFMIIHKLKSIFMYKFTTDNRPFNFANYFVKNASVHDHRTLSSHLFRSANFK